MANLYLLLTLCPPMILAVIFFILSSNEKKEHEEFKSILCSTVFYLQFITGIVFFFLVDKSQNVSLSFVHMKDYHYDFTFLVDHTSIYLGLIFSLLFILIEKLSYNYLHGEEEHARFYTLKLFLNFATMSFILGTNIDFLFFNWEIVGISSALLISYFYRRNQAVEHSIFAFSIYRLCDAAFLLSGLMLFYYYHTEDINVIGSGVAAAVLGLLFFFSILGKSGIYPFSSWLPLALEGPTPSSNMYYMTVSTHLGAVFLMKTYSLWGGSTIVKLSIITVCLINIFITSRCAKVQASIKGALAYSALAQVSVIIIEVSLGFHFFALAHLGLHIFYRFVQMTNSPSIIDQHNLIERYSHGDLNTKKRGWGYYYALHGFMSEVIVLKTFKILLSPIIFINNLESKLLGHEDIPTDQKPVFVGRG